MEENNGSYKTRGLVSIAIENPHLIVVACLFVIILGTLSILKLPKDLLPSANLPAVQVISFYPGLPPYIIPFDPMAAVPLALAEDN